MKHFFLLGILLLASVSSSNAASVWAHYSFDSNFVDDSGNSRDGTLTQVGALDSGITTTDPVFGSGSMNFTADRDYLAIPSKTFSSGTPYTVAFWAKKAGGDTGSSAQWDMVLGDRDNTNFFIALNDASGSGGRQGLRWRSSSSATNRQADFAAADDTAWHHYAVVASGTTITLYVDGSFVSTASGKQTGMIIDTIGEAYSTASDFDFHGQLDEMWIFEDALDATEVANLEEFNTIVPEPGTTAIAAIALLGLLRRRR